MNKKESSMHSSVASILLYICSSLPDTLTLDLFPTALILEEIAIDCHNKETEERLLQEAHDLHLSSLQLAKKAFGEFNVQTAKHYGNLGRLYQSMRKFKVTGGHGL
ncbi:Amyloid protein-binding protein 2 [Xenoophorus captivus]|uniref:Amyloid protein-binding protein 2 n=1 Tax=Xenoophorus captivus TaxID=1517983 RepID=A0ABV0RZ86_9TELE